MYRPPLRGRPIFAGKKVLLIAGFREIRDAFPDTFNHCSFPYSAFACLRVRISVFPQREEILMGGADVPSAFSRYHFEEERLRTESEHCTKSGH
jgi:hypothetical protein